MSKKLSLNKGFLQNSVAVFVAILLIFGAYMTDLSRPAPVYALACSAFDATDQATCETGHTGCAWDAIDCSIYNEMDCNSHTGCSPYISNCSWNAPDCTGDVNCNAGYGTDEATCYSITYFGSCSGTYYPGTCSGSYTPPENCATSFDEDEDGQGQCGDSNCFGNATYCTTETENGGSCTDAVDNDGDTDVDYADLDCLIAPGTPDLTTDTGSSNTDNITKEATPDFTVSCNGTLGVSLRESGVEIDSGICSGNSVTFTDVSLSESIHTLYAVQTLEASASAQSGDLVITIDTTSPSAPGTPDLQADSDLGFSSGDDQTSDTTPTFDISCEIGAVVSLIVGGSIYGTEICPSSTAAITSPTLGPGIWNFGSRQTDVAGNDSSDSLNLVIIVDTSKPYTPGIPDLSIASDFGFSSSDNLTNDTSPTFTVSCDENGTTINLLDEGNSVLGTGTCDGASAAITLGGLSEGVYTIKARQIDFYGNENVLDSGTLSFSIDTSAPGLSSISPASSSFIDNVTSSSDISFTADEALMGGTIAIERTSGTADANSPHGCTLVGTALDSGTHTIDLSDTTNGCAVDASNLVSEAVYTFTFAGTDLAGNGATPVPSTGVTFDITAPTITNVSSGKANGSYTVGETINVDVTFSEDVTSIGLVTVTLETGATDRTCTFSVSASSTASCSYIVQAGDTTSDLAVKTISGAITDPISNFMSNFVPTSNFATKDIIIDTTTPVLTEGTAVPTPSTDTTPSYTFASTEAGTITYGGSCTSGTTSAISGSNPITFSTLAIGTYSNCTITVTDTASNVSNTLAVSSFTITAPSSDSATTTEQTINTAGPSSGGGGFVSAPGITDAYANTNTTTVTVTTNNTNTVSPTVTTGTGLPTNYKFTRTTSVGTRNTEVLNLQKFLNSQGYKVSTSGAGAPGKETTYFGPATRAALARFQKLNGITPSVGFFGPITRAFINKMLGKY